MTTHGEALPLRAAPGRSPWRAVVLAFGLAVVAVLVFVVAFFLAYARLHDGRIVPGVRVAGVALGGLGRVEAETLLRQSLPSVSNGALTLTIGDRTETISYGELGRDYRVHDALVAAFSVGREGGPVVLARSQLQSITRGVEVPMPVTWDRAALDRRVAQLLGPVDAPATDAHIRVQEGRYVVEPASSGASVDIAAVQSDAAAAVDAASTGDAAVRVSPAAIEPTYTTAEAEAAAATANAMGGHAVTVTDGTNSATLAVETVRGWVQVSATPDGDFVVTLDEPTLGAAVEQAARRLGQPATDAGFAFGSGGSIGAVPSAEGRAVDVPATVQLVVGALEAQTPAAAAAPTIEAVMRTVEPGFTTAEAQAAAPRVERVSTWTTSFLPGRTNFFGKNISTPTSVIDGTFVAPGKVFDFWQVVGEVNRETGYGEGGAIINGETVIGPVGGGICSCSTTIFNAALRAGLEMGSRQNHYYYITRYPIGLDATVWKSSSGAQQTVSFRNDTEFPVLIKGINRYGRVKFEIWTVPTGRTVDFSRPRIEDRSTARDTIRYTDDLAPGASERIEYPANGFKVWVTRTVRDASGAVIHEETYYSRYSRVDGVTLVGRRAGDPPDGTVVVVG